MLFKNPLNKSYLFSNLSFANPNNDSTPDFSTTPQTPLKDSEILITQSIPDLTVGLVTPTKKNYRKCGNKFFRKKDRHNDTKTQYEKVKVESFNENILQNLRNDIKEILDNEFTAFKSKCEEMVKILSVRYNKEIDHLQNELKTSF